MLVNSTKLSSAVDVDYFKKKLYINSRDISDIVYKRCADLVNFLKTIIPPKEDMYQDDITTYIKVRKLRIALTNHAAKNKIPYIKYRPVNLYIEASSENSSASSLYVQPKLLYFIAHKKYQVYCKEESLKSTKISITSAHSIRNRNDKQKLLTNFFNTKFLLHQFNIRNLEPTWSFSFTDRYNLHSVCKKTSNTSDGNVVDASEEEKEDGEVEASVLIGDVIESRSEAEIVNEIEPIKKEIHNLEQRLREAKVTRADIGNQIRAFNKSQST